MPRSVAMPRTERSPGDHANHSSPTGLRPPLRGEVAACYTPARFRAGRFARAGLAQLVEQLFRKQQVAGSSPAVGSRDGPGKRQANRPKWRNRQTRYVQGVVGESPWEFKSPLRHHGPSRPSVDPSDRAVGDGGRPAPAGRRGTFTTEGEAGRMVAGPSGSEESPSCTERGCPAKAGAAPRGVDSPDWRAGNRARATETKADGATRTA